VLFTLWELDYPTHTPRIAQLIDIAHVQDWHATCFAIAPRALVSSYLGRSALHERAFPFFFASRRWGTHRKWAEALGEAGIEVTVSGRLLHSLKGGGTMEVSRYGSWSAALRQKWTHSRSRGRGVVDLVTVMCAICIGAGASAEPMLHLNVGGSGPDGTTTVGGQVTVEVLASEIPAGSDGLGMFGMGFDITFDASGLSTAAPVLGPLWSSTGFDDSRNDPGNVGLTSNRFFEPSGPFGDDILLGTIVFSGLTQGLFSLTLGHFTGIGDNNLFDFTTLDDAPSFFTSGSIDVVPEPSTLALVYVCGMGALLIRRRPSERR
jgi:hypothetical protein